MANGITMQIARVVRRGLFAMLLTRQNPRAWQAGFVKSEKPVSFDTGFSVFWWRGKDSNLRRQNRQIYSLIPLTAREPRQNRRRIMSTRLTSVKPLIAIFLHFFR